MKTPKIRNFDEYIYNDSLTQVQLSKYLNGHNDKGFVLCDSEFFRELFDEIKNNPNSSYDTYLNRFIKEDYDGTNLPISEVSCLKKEGENNLIEEFVSKLGNALHIPTVFIKNYPRESQEEFKKRLDEMIANAKPGSFICFSSEDYMLSVDFIRENEHFETINEYSQREVCKRGSSINAWFGIFENEKLINPLTYQELTHEEKMELFREFIPQYFFRRHIVRDWDFKGENVGILYNQKTGKYRLAPMFDFEYCYYKAKSQNNEQLFDEDLIFAYDCFPEETSKIINTLRTFDIDNFIDNLHLESVKTDITKNAHKALIQINYNRFLNSLNEFEETPHL